MSNSGNGSTRTRSLGIVVSHPIQYYAHQYRYIAGLPGVALKVFFASDMGSKTYFDSGFQKSFSWKMPILEGYDHVFLKEQETSAPPLSLTRELAAFRPEAVAIHGYSQAVSRTAWLWAAAHRVPVYMIGDSNIRDELRKPLWLRLVKQVLLRPMFLKTAGMLAIGSANEAYYAYYGVSRSRLFRVPFTVNPAFFELAPAERERARGLFRDRLGIARDAVVGLWCGKMTDAKKPMDYVRALAASREAGSPVPLTALFAGDGDRRAQLEESARAAGVRAAYAGFLNVDEMPAAYAAADFLVHTRPHEPYGLVATEAALMGLPMIVPESMGAVGPTDAAQPGRNALVYRDGDLDALRRHLETLAGQPELRRTMSLESEAVYREIRGQFESGIAGWLARINQSSEGAAR